MDGLVDLHLHSTFSDGTCTPEEIVALAGEAGLAAAVLTDHDTMEGTPRFLDAARKAGIRSIAGMEISADVPHRTVHLLAYGCDPDEPRLAAALRRVRDGRAERNARILEKLAKLGCPITMDEVRAEAGNDKVVGRPHIAAALVRRGFAADPSDAFRRFLARGAAAYADRYRLSPDDALELVAGAGGIVSLAHPASTGYNPAELRRFDREATLPADPFPLGDGPDSAAFADRLARERASLLEERAKHVDAHVAELERRIHDLTRAGDLAAAAAFDADRAALLRDPEYLAARDAGGASTPAP